MERQKPKLRISTDPSTSLHQRLANLSAMLLHVIWTDAPIVSLLTQQRYLLLRQHCLSILKRTNFAPSVVILGLLFIHRLKMAILRHGWSCPDSFKNALVLWTSTLYLAHKFLDDKTYNTESWSKITHLPRAQIVLAEHHVLERLDFNLFVPQDVFISWKLKVQNLIQTGMANIKSQRVGGVTPITPTSLPSGYLDSAQILGNQIPSPMEDRTPSSHSFPGRISIQSLMNPTTDSHRAASIYRPKSLDMSAKNHYSESMFHVPQSI